MFAKKLKTDLKAVLASRRSSSSYGSDELGRDLCTPGVQPSSEERCRDLLQQFLERARAIPSLPEGVVREMLRPAPRPALPGNA